MTVTIESSLPENRLSLCGHAERGSDYCYGCRLLGDGYLPVRQVGLCARKR
jgi:hypothetical protein